MPPIVLDIIWNYWIPFKNLGPSQKTLHPSWCSNLVTGLTLSHKLYDLCHKSLKDLYPSIGYHYKERLKRVYTYASIRSRGTGAKHRHRTICKSNLLKWKHWPSTKGGTHGPRPQTDAIFSICFTKCFQNKSESGSEPQTKIFGTKMLYFTKHLLKERVFETEAKLFLFLKWIDFNMQTKVKVFPKRK